jgi:crotonobetainyl-CoA:carnitine CoA-transferase CaiB-like acyl-CoA transferase
MNPLDGIRILDLSRVLAGPWCTQTLADLGADVIKIERPGAGDDTRSWGPPFLKDADGKDTPEAAYSSGTNRNKRSLTCDISKSEGQALIRELVMHCHVFIENFKVGDMARYGLDYNSLKTLNPKLVYCSVTGFGQTGPYSDRAGYDYAIQGIGGLMSVTGERDDLGGGPQKVGVAVADLFTGMYATVGILAALRHAEKQVKANMSIWLCWTRKWPCWPIWAPIIWSVAKLLTVLAMRTKILCLTKFLK